MDFRPLVWWALAGFGGACGLAAGSIVGLLIWNPLVPLVGALLGGIVGYTFGRIAAGRA